jgi:hypothetical protein
MNFEITDKRLLQGMYMQAEFEGITIEELAVELVRVGYSVRTDPEVGIRVRTPHVGLKQEGE